MIKNEKGVDFFVQFDIITMLLTTSKKNAARQCGMV